LSSGARWVAFAWPPCCDPVLITKYRCLPYRRR
jgi:hypothetical protein